MWLLVYMCILPVDVCELWLWWWKCLQWVSRILDVLYNKALSRSVNSATGPAAPSCVFLSANNKKAHQTTAERGDNWTTPRSLHPAFSQTLAPVHWGHSLFTSAAVQLPWQERLCRRTAVNDAACRRGTVFHPVLTLFDTDLSTGFTWNSLTKRQYIRL